ncbi:MAG: hypothetical protein WC612_03290 [Bdellovibrionales bacterium]|jgi:hypothetical protein
MSLKTFFQSAWREISGANDPIRIAAKSVRLAAKNKDQEKARENFFSLLGKINPDDPKAADLVLRDIIPFCRENLGTHFACKMADAVYWRFWDNLFLGATLNSLRFELAKEAMNEAIEKGDRGAFVDAHEIYCQACNPLDKKVSTLWAKSIGLAIPKFGATLVSRMVDEVRWNTPHGTPLREEAVKARYSLCEDKPTAG